MTRAFTDVVRDIDGGALAEELTEQLSELVNACSNTGKAGELTLRLKVKPGKAQSPIVTVLHDVKVKAPEFDRREQYFFIGGGASLVLENPHQGKLDLRGVDRDRGEVKGLGAGERVDEETGEIISGEQQAG